MKLLLIFSLVLSTALASQPQPRRQWHAATYRGIRIGKSRLADVLRAWGKPKWSRTSKPEGNEESRPVTWTNYERVGEFPGPTTVVSDKRNGVVTRINFYPNRLTKEQAVAHFGANYIVTRYAFDSCFDEEEAEAIYESPDGPVTEVEYRGRGIAISVGQNDLVTMISYVGGPVGSAKSRCR